jgi:hypothetical protein
MNWKERYSFEKSAGFADPRPEPSRYNRRHSPSFSQPTERPSAYRKLENLVYDISDRPKETFDRPSTLDRLTGHATCEGCKKLMTPIVDRRYHNITRYNNKLYHVDCARDAKQKADAQWHDTFTESE